MSKRKIVSQILAERKRQDAKWGEQNHPDDRWLSILGEEFGEACEASLQGRTDDLVKELVQIAAVVVAFIECIQRTPTNRRQDIDSLQQELASAREEIRELKRKYRLAKNGYGELTAHSCPDELE